ncbi:uncharacterized protein LOC108671516 isoform X2 [Hyalella azteca]|nr:uncharacterized protein LOC108671516 isoform X2 [Hyalella azteca]
MMSLATSSGSKLEEINAKKLKLCKEIQVKITKFTPPKEWQHTASFSSNSINDNESNPENIERIVLPHSASGNEVDACNNVNGDINGEFSGNETGKGKRTKNIPIKSVKNSIPTSPRKTSTKNSRNSSHSPAESATAMNKRGKSPKKKVSKNHNVTDIQAPEKRQADKSEVGDDMPLICSSISPAVKSDSNYTSGNPKKSTRKRKLSDINVFAAEQPQNSAVEKSTESKNRTLFPRKRVNRLKRENVEASISAKTRNYERSPTKSILVSRDHVKSKEKTLPSKFSKAFNVQDKKDGNPTKKKVKFDSAMSSELLDFSEDHSIEALTELVRQKRIRPPYGQPYSVTGTWYIASGYLKDLAALLEEFDKQPDARFSSFAVCWRQMLFTQIFRGRQSFKELLEFSEEIVVLTKKFLENMHSDRRRLGAFYTLYSIYYKHPVRHEFFLRFTVKQYKDLVDLVLRQPHYTNPDPARILIKLHVDCAILQTASENELCIGLHTAYNSSSVCVEYGYLRLAQSSNVPLAVQDLSTDMKLVTEYHRVKTAASQATQDGANNSGPDRALSIFSPSCCEEVKQELLQLEDYTLTLLSFKGQHAVHARPELHSDPMLALGEKRYAIQQRATSITAAEKYARKHEQTQENEESVTDNPSVADNPLDVVLAQQRVCVSSKPTLFVRKLAIEDSTEDDENSVSDLSKIPPSAYGFKGPWQPSLGQSVVKRRRGRNPTYLNTRDRSLPHMPIAAAEISLNARQRKDRIKLKQALRGKVDLSLDVKALPAQLEKSAMGTPTILTQDVKGFHSVDDDSFEENGCFTALELCDLGETVGPHDENTSDNEQENNSTVSSERGRKNPSLLEITLQMLVNGKRVTNNIKANMSIEMFEFIKRDPEQIKRLMDKISLMTLPRLRAVHGQNVDVRDMQIIKAQRCQPESVKPQDFITGNQPFVKSGKCNIRMRMRMMERFNQKTPVAAKVEQIEEMTRTKAQLVPIVVGNELRYIQCGADDPNESLPSTPRAWQTNSVLRSHNCNWNRAKRIGPDFKTFKYELNASNENQTKVKAITEEWPIVGKTEIKRIIKKENDPQPCSLVKSLTTGCSYVTVGKPKQINEEPVSHKRSTARNTPKRKPVASDVKSSAINLKRKNESCISNKKKSDSPKKKTNEKASTSANNKSIVMKNLSEQSRAKPDLKSKTRTKQPKKSTSRNSKNRQPISKLSSHRKQTGVVVPDSKPEMKAIKPVHSWHTPQNPTDSVNFNARIPWSNKVEPHTESDTNCNEETMQSGNWPDSLLLSPETERSLAAMSNGSEKTEIDVKEGLTELVNRSNKNRSARSNVFEESVNELSNDWEMESACDTSAQGDNKPVTNSEDIFHEGNITRLEEEKSPTDPLSHESNGVVDDYDSPIDPGTENECISDYMPQNGDNVTDAQLVDQLQQNGVSVMTLPENVSNINSPYLQPAMTRVVPQTTPQFQSSFTLPKNNTHLAGTTCQPSNVSPMLSFNEPALSQSQQGFPSPSGPLLLPPAPVQQAFFAPPNQSYIRANTHDGAQVILPYNTFFSIVEPDGSETNATELHFNNSANPIMIRSQPVIQSTIPFISDPSGLSYISSEPYGNFCSPSLPALTAHGFVSSSIISGTQPYTFGTTMNNTFSVARSPIKSSVMTSHSMQPRCSLSTSDLEPAGALRSSPLKNVKSRLSSTISSDSVSCLESCPSSASEATIVSPTTMADYSRMRCNEERTANIAKPIITKTSSCGESHKSQPLLPPTPVISNGTSSLEVTKSAGKKTVCSFLLSNKFKKLGSVLGVAAKGSASGKPLPSTKPRVSFFRRGSLMKSPQVISDANP